MKRVLLVQLSIQPPGGANGVAAWALQALVAAHRVTVLSWDPVDIEPPPAFGARIRTDFIQGMGKVKGKFVILLNVDHVLSLDEISNLADVAHAVALPTPQ